MPAKDKNPDAPDSFIVRDGMLVSLGEPRGHLLTEEPTATTGSKSSTGFPGKPGNCGILVHASRLRALSGMFPQSIEVQMNHLHAGDFWCIHENIEVPDMEARRPRKEGQKYGGTDGDARRILNLTDNSEKPLGEWNTMVDRGPRPDVESVGQRRSGQRGVQQHRRSRADRDPGRRRGGRVPARGDWAAGAREVISVP